MAYISPLERPGATTVVGTRSSVLDPAVRLLGNAYHEKMQSVAQTETDIELEIRLGIVAHKRLAEDGGSSSWVDRSTQKRIDLPSKTEVPLKVMNGFDYHFVPGVTRETFVRLDGRLTAMCRTKELRALHSMEVTVDDFYVDSRTQDRVRVTYDMTSSATGASHDDMDKMAFQKHNHWKFDFYAGRKDPQCGPVFDFRMALNSEKPLIDFELDKGIHTFQMRRQKHRSVYKFRAWRVDLTHVATSYPREAGAGPEDRGTPQHTYEVEIEIDGPLLRENLRMKMAQKQNSFWELLSDFVSTARDLAGFAGQPGPMARPMELPTGEAASPIITSDDKEAFSIAYKGLPEPVIGHYLYRLATDAFSKSAVGQAVAASEKADDHEQSQPSQPSKVEKPAAPKVKHDFSKVSLAASYPVLPANQSFEPATPIFVAGLGCYADQPVQANRLPLETPVVSTTSAPDFHAPHRPLGMQQRSRMTTVNHTRAGKSEAAADAFWSKPMKKMKPVDPKKRKRPADEDSSSSDESPKKGNPVGSAPAAPAFGNSTVLLTPDRSPGPLSFASSPRPPQPAANPAPQAAPALEMEKGDCNTLKIRRKIAKDVGKDPPANSTPASTSTPPKWAQGSALAAVKKLPGPGPIAKA